MPRNSRPTSPARRVACPGCGRVCASRSGLATHARSCRIERARSDAYCEAIEHGLSIAETAAHMREAIRAAREGLPRPIPANAYVVVCSTECGRLSVRPLVTEAGARFYAEGHAEVEPGHVVVVEPATLANVQ